MKPARRLDTIDAVIALVVCVGYVALLVRTVRDLGYARDEGFYFVAADSYGRWLSDLWRLGRGAFDARVVDGAWGNNHEHPGFAKGLFALSNLLLQKKLHLFAMEGTSYRFPGMLLAGGLLSAVYLWGAELHGRAAGLAAALFLGAMPRFFYHAHLACFDVPITAMFTLTAWTYARAVARGGAWRFVAAAVAFGLALDTKHNSWFLPFLVVGHVVALSIWPWLLRADAGDAAARARARLAAWRNRAAVALGAMVVVGPPVFYALWPWIWHDTRARLLAYARFHLGHEYYNMELFGRTYWQPPMPRSYAWVMTLATVPTVTLACAALGIALAARQLWLARRTPKAAGAMHVLWIGAIAVSYAPWLRTTTPIFGGTKHWFTAYPFVALFAGLAFGELVRVARAWARRSRRRGFPSVRGPFPEMALALLVFAAPVTETVRSHPWGLSSYVPLVGGAAGAATLGLNRTFWGYTTGAVAEYLDRQPRGSSVYVHDTAGPAWDMLIKDGRLRRDLRGVWSAADADFALYHHEQHMLGQEYQAWVAFGTVRPDHVAGLDGVPVIWIYKRARAR